MAARIGTGAGHLKILQWPVSRANTGIPCNNEQCADDVCFPSLQNELAARAKRKAEDKFYHGLCVVFAKSLDRFGSGMKSSKQ
eukprot:6210970-Pleurochrysis_carterae.AAC.3